MKNYYRSSLGVAARPDNLDLIYLERDSKQWTDRDREVLAWLIAEERRRLKAPRPMSPTDRTARRLARVKLREATKQRHVARIEALRLKREIENAKPGLIAACAGACV